MKNSSFFQFIKFTLFSISAGIVQIGSFAFFEELTSWSYWPSYLISLILSILWNFTFNKRFTFQSAANVPVAMTKLFAFYIVFTPLSTYLGHVFEGMGVNDYIILIVTMLCNFILEFVFSKSVIYRNQEYTLLTSRSVIEKWYKKLNFPKEFDNEFYESLNKIHIPDNLTYEKYDLDSTDGKKNLLAFLYFCESLSKKYKEKSIGDDILCDTLQDIVRWTKVHSEIKGELYLGELRWLYKHIDFKLFKLGRLQFCMEPCEKEYNEDGLHKGNPIISVHIPSEGPLDDEEVNKSFARLTEFFNKYFPEFNYKYITCHSWLLGETATEILPENSNISKFASLFEIKGEDVSDELIRYLLRYDATRENIDNFTPKSSLATKIKEEMKNGKIFHDRFGVIPKETFNK